MVVRGEHHRPGPTQRFFRFDSIAMPLPLENQALLDPTTNMLMTWVSRLQSWQERLSRQPSLVISCPNNSAYVLHGAQWQEQYNLDDFLQGLSEGQTAYYAIAAALTPQQACHVLYIGDFRRLIRHLTPGAHIYVCDDSAHDEDRRIRRIDLMHRSGLVDVSHCQLASPYYGYQGRCRGTLLIPLEDR